MPAIFGHAIAAVVISDLARSPLDNPTSRDPLALKTKRKMWELYSKHFNLSAADIDRIFPGELSDLIMIACKHQCHFTKVRTGLYFVPLDLDSARQGDRANVVLATKSAAVHHLLVTD
jgi:hypothetical protein